VGGVGKGPWVWAIPVVRAVGGLSLADWDCQEEIRYKSEL